MWGWWGGAGSDRFVPTARQSWICCDTCGKWRKVPEATIKAFGERTPWQCALNIDRRFSACDVPEEGYTDDDDDEADGGFSESLTMSSGGYIDLVLARFVEYGTNMASGRDNNRQCGTRVKWSELRAAVGANCNGDFSDSNAITPYNTRASSAATASSSVMTRPTSVTGNRWKRRWADIMQGEQEGGCPTRGSRIGHAAYQSGSNLMNNTATGGDTSDVDLHGERRRRSQRSMRVLIPARGPPRPSVLCWLKREHSTLFHMWLGSGRPELQYHQTEIDMPVNHAPRVLEYLGQYLPSAVPLGCPMSAWQPGRPLDDSSVPLDWTMQPEHVVVLGAGAVCDGEHQPAIYARDTREPPLLGHVLVAPNGNPTFRIAGGCRSDTQYLSSCHLVEGCISLTPSEASLVTSAFRGAVDPMLSAIPVIVTRVTNSAQLDIAARACLCRLDLATAVGELNHALSENDEMQVTFMNGMTLQHRLDLTNLPDETSLADFNLEPVSNSWSPLGIVLWEPGRVYLTPYSAEEEDPKFATATLFTPCEAGGLPIDWQLVRFLVLKRDSVGGVIRAVSVPQYTLDALGIPHLGSTTTRDGASAVTASVHEAIMLSRAFGIFVTRRYRGRSSSAGV